MVWRTCNRHRNIEDVEGGGGGGGGASIPHAMAGKLLPTRPPGDGTYIYTYIYLYV